jgi:type I restriction enzyme M protein
MAKEKKVKSLEETLFESCNKLRSNMSGINYMYFTMGLVFLKFASLKFEERRQELLNSPDKDFVDIPSFYQEKSVFYLTPNSRWSLIKDSAKKPDIGIIIDKALQELEDNNPKQLKGALPVDVYAKTSLPAEKFASLINEIDKIHTDADHPMNDLIGKTYQYFLNKFAIKTADEKGEFYTPDNIVDLITTLIEPYSGKVYDPCCGSGGMFVQSYKFVEAHHGNIDQVSVYGQESNPDTWKLAKMNLAIRGIPCKLGDHEADTFSKDWFKDVKMDFIIANPPFNLKDWRTETTLVDDVRWAGYGLPPVSNANYAWILHMLNKLSFNGVAGFLLANGALGDTDTVEIRKNLIKNDKIEAIIVLPREMFYYTDISVTLWIMRNHKNSVKVIRDGKEVQLRDRNGQILFMDLRTKGSRSAEGYIELGYDTDMKLAKDTYNAWQSLDYETLYKDVPEFCKSVSNKDIETDNGKLKTSEEIASSNWSLVPSKYIEFIDHDLNIDFDKEMSRIQNEMGALLEEEKKSQDELIKAFDGIGYGIK